MFLQKIRLKFANLYFVIPFCCLFFYVTTEATASPISAVEFSGQEYFEGIFLGNGPVAESVPELRGLNPRSIAKDRNELNEIIDYQNSLVSRVSEENPDYFSELEKAIQSRNPVMVKSTIEKGAAIMKSITDSDGHKVNDEDRAQVEQLFQSYGNGEISSSELSAGVKAYTLDRSPHMELAGVVLWLAIVLWVVLWIPVMADHGAELYTERVVDSLIKL